MTESIISSLPRTPEQVDQGLSRFPEADIVFTLRAIGQLLGNSQEDMPDVLKYIDRLPSFFSLGNPLLPTQIPLENAGEIMGVNAPMRWKRTVSSSETPQDGKIVRSELNVFSPYGMGRVSCQWDNVSEGSFLGNSQLTASINEGGVIEEFEVRRNENDGTYTFFVPVYDSERVIGMSRAVVGFDGTITDNFIRDFTTLPIVE